MTEKGMTLGILVDSNILLDMSASKSFMSKRYYLGNKSFRDLQKLSRTARYIQVKNAKFCNVLFVIPMRVNIYCHVFEIHNTDFRIHDHVDLVLSLKNMYQLGGGLSTRDQYLRFLHRSVPLL